MVWKLFGQAVKPFHRPPWSVRLQRGIIGQASAPPLQEVGWPTHLLWVVDFGPHKSRAPCQTQALLNVDNQIPRRSRGAPGPNWVGLHQEELRTETLPSVYSGSEYPPGGSGPQGGRAEPGRRSWPGTKEWAPPRARASAGTSLTHEPEKAVQVGGLFSSSRNNA